MTPDRFALVLTSILMLFLFAGSAAADEVRLANGDRLTGRVVSLAGGTLTFATPNGDLRIPWANVTALSVDEPILVTRAAAPAAPVTGSIALADITALARPKPAVVVDGGANAIFTNDRFRDLDLRTALGAGVGYQVLQTRHAHGRCGARLGEREPRIRPRGPLHGRARVGGAHGHGGARPRAVLSSA